ncbi:MAG TPA: methyl-accepting chemotaxis protein, partial [Polyangiaceae bacterium]
MGRSITTRSVVPLLAVDIIFNLLVPFAYFSFFHIEDTSLVLGFIALLNVVRIGIWVPLLIQLLGPAERFSRSFEGAQTESALRSADAALQNGPLRFSLVYSLLWGSQYLILTILLLYATPERTPLPPRAIVGALLMSGAQIPGSFAFAFPLEALLVADQAGRLSLLARARNIILERPPSSLQGRVAGLAICIAIGPTAWIAAVGYMSVVDASVRESATSAELAALRLAAEVSTLAANGKEVNRDAVRAALEREMTEDTTPFLLTSSGRFFPTPARENELLQNPRMARWLSDDLTKAESAIKTDVRSDTTVATRKVDGQYVAGALVRSGSIHSVSFLRTIAIFGLIVALWAPVCAVFLSRSVVVPLAKITSAARQVIQVGKLSEMGRIPVVQSDEAGILAEHINELLDLLARLSAAAGAVASGDLGVTIDGRGDLPNAFRQMIVNLQGMVREIRETSVQLASAATEIYAASQEQEASATSQSTAMVEISRTADSLSEAAAHVSDAVAGVLSNAERTLGTTEQMVVRIGELSSHASRIGEILEVIREVADRSDLLALNGSLEACRAGESGRGFSL